MKLLSKPGIGSEAVRILQAMINNCVVVEFNHSIKLTAINLRRTSKVKLPDAIIAATTRYLDMPLLTTDKDFKKLSNIELLFLNI